MAFGLLWEPELIWLHVLSDAVIACRISYSVALSIFRIEGPARPDSFILLGMFALFITACGFTHVLSIGRSGCRSMA